MFIRCSNFDEIIYSYASSITRYFKRPDLISCITFEER